MILTGNLLDNSTKLKTMILRPIINDWPASMPLIPANILMALVQNTASIPMYMKYNTPVIKKWILLNIMQINFDVLALFQSHNVSLVSWVVSEPKLHQNIQFSTADQFLDETSGQNRCHAVTLFSFKYINVFFFLRHVQKYEQASTHLVIHFTKSTSEKNFSKSYLSQKTLPFT